MCHQRSKARSGDGEESRLLPSNREHCGERATGMQVQVQWSRGKAQGVATWVRVAVVRGEWWFDMGGGNAKTGFATYR